MATDDTSLLSELDKFEAEMRQLADEHSKGDTTAVAASASSTDAPSSGQVPAAPVRPPGPPPSGLPPPPVVPPGPHPNMAFPPPPRVPPGAAGLPPGAPRPPMGFPPPPAPPVGPSAPGMGQGPPRPPSGIPPPPLPPSMPHGMAGTTGPPHGLPPPPPPPPFMPRSLTPAVHHFNHPPPPPPPASANMPMGGMSTGGMGSYPSAYSMPQPPMGAMGGPLTPAAPMAYHPAQGQQPQQVWSHDPQPFSHESLGTRQDTQAQDAGAGSGATKKEKKEKKEKKPAVVKRTAAGMVWEDPSLQEWPENDHRLFCGNLGNEVNDEVLAIAFRKYPSFQKAKVVRDKTSGKTKGYGFVSLGDVADYAKAIREMNGKYVGNRPIQLKKSTWDDRKLDPTAKSGGKPLFFSKKQLKRHIAIDAV
eukprot:jgi/Mesvir1/17844/Mv12929-RA.1